MCSPSRRRPPAVSLVSLALADTVENQVITQPAATGRKLATLVVVQGSDADLGANTRIEKRVVIGRDPAAELSLSDARASKQHAPTLPNEASEGNCGIVAFGHRRFRER